MARNLTWVLGAISALSPMMLQHGSALASELHHKHRVPVVESRLPVSWSGFYFGAETGGAWQNDAIVETSAGIPGYSHAQTAQSSGIIGGVFAGYNFEKSPFVYGIEGDIETTGLQQSTLYSNSAKATFGSQTKFEGSVRARLGFAFDRALLYATAGPAFAQIDDSYSYNVSENIGSFRVGYTVGGGIETALSEHWLGRIEYRYTDFGTLVDSPAIAWSGYSESRHVTQNSLMAGISYKF